MNILSDSSYTDPDYTYVDEIFIPINKQGEYLISNMGRVLRPSHKFARFSAIIETKKKIIKPTINKHGYSVFNINLSGRKKTVYFHRVIATAWLPNPEKLREVDHINCDKTDNRISNLEWVSSKENKRRAVATGLFDRKGEKHHGNKLNADQVRDALKRNLIKKESQASIARSYGLNTETIRLICIGTNWPHIYQEFIKEINP